MSPRDFLTRRNALWAHLRSLPPGSPEFEATLAELSALIGWVNGWSGMSKVADEVDLAAHLVLDQYDR